MKIRRPRPWPRQGRRLGPPQVWNFSFLAFQGCLPALKSHRLNIPLACFILQPTGTARRHINVFFLLMGVPTCPLPRPGGPSLPFAMVHPAANRHPKATHQCLLIGVQACRLPALKHLKPLKTFQTLKTLTTRHGGPSLPFARPARPHINGFLWASQPAVCQALNIPLACFILQPTGTPRPHINVFLWASKPAVCQPLNA